MNNNQKESLATYKRRNFVRSIIIFVLFALPLSAKAQDHSQIDRLEKRLIEMQQRFEQIEHKQEQEISLLKTKLEALSKKEPSPSEQQKLTEQIAAELKAQDNATETPPAPTASPPAQPITVARAGSSYMNMSFSSIMDGGWSTAEKPSKQLELADHDPQKRGFSLRNAEIALDGAVDPYLKGFANIVLKLDDNDQTEIELEESYLQTTSLPDNLQVKAGQFFANFGRQNPQHPHQWSFVDQPLVLSRAFGPDGLRSIGTQVSWLIPTPFYSEVFLGILDGQGSTAFNFRNPGDDNGNGTSSFRGNDTNVKDIRGPGDLLFTPRVAASFDLTDTQTLVTGLSGAFGPNSSGDGNSTQVYGADLYWKWKPENADAGFPFVAFQTEGLYTNYEALQTQRDYGFYSQILYGFKPQWVIGLRDDYVDGNHVDNDEANPFRGERFRLSPVVTYYPSEFSKVRLQYNYDTGEYISDASSIWMQLEFDLGSHAAHKF